MKVLAIDYGTKNIGLALSDETARFAGTLPLLKNQGDERAVMELVNIARREKVGELLLGSPLLNPQSPMSERIAKFGRELGVQSGLPLRYWDESYSSSKVEAGLRGKRRKSSDSLVAYTLLQEYLDYLIRNKKP